MRIGSGLASPVKTMKSWIALFRGINVGGNNVLPMKKLVTLLEKANCRDVRTYIQSGNVVLRSSVTDPARLAKRIGAAVSAGCGFEPQVMLVDREELERAAAANPFATVASTNPKAVHLFFLAEHPRTPDLESLDRLKAGSESYSLEGTVLYLCTPDGFGTSKLAARIERHLGVPATARNWRTVMTLLDLAKSEH
ncbi:MAG TPA: DUF1697 domain-containing protein [Steroidobacteraceae bacterium]|nr:DUF1697 domain-containing protein [Steroidobacteraceae bacterium]